MPKETSFDVLDIIRNSDESKSVNVTTNVFPSSVIGHTVISIIKNHNISPLACLGFAVLILTTVIGNTLVLAALFIDKRLHRPSYFLIANMAIADLLLGIAVLPFSSVLELLNNRWIFGENLCSAWLALDVLCCTASIIGLAGVSIDRYIGVTRPLKYNGIMTIRRTIYLIIIIWAMSILTSVVPLFGLAGRETSNKTVNTSYEVSATCEVNKNTFYTIFSSTISFYIPVIILLILYSRIYQEAKEQGRKLENEKRRLLKIDFHIASQHARKQQTEANEHPIKLRTSSNRSDDTKIDPSSTLLNHENIPDDEGIFQQNSSSNYEDLLKKNHTNLQNAVDDDGSHSGISLDRRKSRVRSLIDRSILSPIRRNSMLQNSHFLHYGNHMSSNDEILLLKDKLHNLKCEKKAFRTVGLILGALLICWMPFFVTLPLMAILKEYGIINDENTASTWFKITFWLGYCNSALNPFVYAFSNRAIRRAFREVICRRFCFCRVCQKKSNIFHEQANGRRRGTDIVSLAGEVSKISSKRGNSCHADTIQTVPKIDDNIDDTPHQPLREPNAHKPVVSFAEVLDEDDPDEDSSHNYQKSSSELTSTVSHKNSNSNLNS